MADNSNGQAEGEHDWFFDCLITFLKSPRWKVPVVSYIEEYCIAFDNEDENKLEYTNIHMNFYRMVDDLLCELVAEMGITREQFKAACEQSAANPTHHKIVQQILNVDDFESFKKMMIKKNMHLEEQAHQEMMKETNVQADPAQTTAQPATGGEDDGMDEQMRLAMEMSRIASEDQDRAAQEEEEMIRQAIEASQQEEQHRIQIVQQEEEQSNEAIAASQISAAPREEVKQPESPVPDFSPQDRPAPQKIEARIDPELQRKEDEKMRQLAELKRKREEEKRNPPKAQPVPQAKPAEPKINPNKFLEEQKEVISKIRKPKVSEVSAFEDIHANATFDKAEDPYAGKSFAEVLKMKREKLEAELAKNAAPSVPAEGAQAAESSEPAAPQGDTIEARRERMRAQRAALLDKRKQEREKELSDYNQSQSGAHLDAARNSFYAQMIKMDKAIPKGTWAPPAQSASVQQPAANGQPVQAPPVQAQAASQGPARSNFNLDDIEGVDIM